MDDKVHISIIAGRPFVFDLTHVRRLRCLGIGGVLSGTLPTAPQQNIFLGLPLQLMSEEAVWLVENNHAILFQEKSFIESLVNDLSPDDIKTTQSAKFEDFQHQKQMKIKFKEELVRSKNNCKNVDEKVTISTDDVAIAQSLFVNIFNTPSNLPNFNLFKSIFEKNKKLQQMLFTSLDCDPLNYKIFNHLKSLDYFLAPGLRFGGKFIAYPGDPLRYHAHLIVNTVDWNQDIGVMNIVSGGRLATGVKKIWLIGSEEKQEDEQESETICFSVEWAGFG